MTTILLAEDFKSIREYCSAILAHDGYRVVVAADGAEAVEAFVLEMPNLVILDVCMPRSNGLEALEQIKKLSPRTPVILFTAHVNACRHDPRSRLATVCIRKSEDLAELKQAVAQILNREARPGDGESWRMGLPPFPANMKYA